MKKQKANLTSFEAGLQAAGLMAEMARAHLAEDEEKFLSINESLFDLKPNCDPHMQECISQVSETENWKDTWSKIQNTILHWLSRHRKELLKALSDPHNPYAPADLMSLLWIFTDGMDNPEWVSSGINSDTSPTFWGLCKNKKEFQDALPRFILAYYYLQDKKDPIRFKNNIDFFYKMMSVNYRLPQPPEPDHFGEIREDLKQYLTDYFNSDAPSWPLEWPSPQTCLKRALSFF